MLLDCRRHMGMLAIVQSVIATHHPLELWKLANHFSYQI